MNIYEKLFTIQQELKATKDKYNDFGKYKYRSCESILEAAKPLLAKTKTIVFMRDRVDLIGERYYTTAIATFVDCENPADTIIVEANAREEDAKKGMDASQVTGSTSSYARKYALNGLFAIDDNQDSDSTNKHDKNNPNSETKTFTKCTAEQVEKMRKLGVLEENIKTRFKVAKLEDLSTKQAQFIIDAKEKYLNKEVANNEENQ